MILIHKTEDISSEEHKIHKCVTIMTGRTYVVSQKILIISITSAVYLWDVIGLKVRSSVAILF